jgi:hypothetical protein
LVLGFGSQSGLLPQTKQGSKSSLIIANDVHEIALFGIQGTLSTAIFSMIFGPPFPSPLRFSFLNGGRPLPVEVGLSDLRDDR